MKLFCREDHTPEPVPPSLQLIRLDMRRVREAVEKAATRAINREISAQIREQYQKGLPISVVSNQSIVNFSEFPPIADVPGELTFQWV